MKSPKEFKVKIEKEITVTLDMDKYSGDTLKELKSFWGLDYDLSQEEVITEMLGIIIGNYDVNGYFDEKMEGVPKNGQSLEIIDDHYYIEE